MTVLDAARLFDIYRDLHTHPELSFTETRTAGIVAKHLREMGFDVTEGVGQTGVVGVLERGDGPCVLIRADMDGLPVEEETGLPYVSTDRSLSASGADVPVMHACGHDMHTTALLGAADALAAAHDWQGRLLVIFQPAEEIGAGARAMVEDGLFERFGTPHVVLGQHVAPLRRVSSGCRQERPRRIRLIAGRAVWAGWAWITTRDDGRSSCAGGLGNPPPADHRLP